MASLSDLRNRRIVFAAPPFAGHLHPILAMAVHLQKLGADCLVLTGPNMTKVVESQGLRVHAMLPGSPDSMESIANTKVSSFGNISVTLQQLRSNLFLSLQIMKEVSQVFDDFKPELVFADFTAVPVVLVANRLGLKVVSVTPTPFAIENKRGTPSYLGGLAPPNGQFDFMRDFLGRCLIRVCKLGIARIFKKELQQIGLTLYREDGSETIYSADSILGLGMTEFEFKRDWPESFKMIGPMQFCPQSKLTIPLSKDKDRKKVLVTTGTHLIWAKRQIIEETRRLRDQFPEVQFFYSMGDAKNATKDPIEEFKNCIVFAYVPYDPYIGFFDAVLHHGGAGITYSCIENGVPMVVRPMDYDQFDYAARIEYFKLGVRVKSYDSDQSLAGLNTVLNCPEQFSTKKFMGHLKSYDPLSVVAKEALRLCTHRL